MHPSTLEILDGWDLMKDPEAAARLSVGDLRKIGQSIDRHYATGPVPDIDGCHIGLSDSIRIAEGVTPLSQLAFSLVTHNHLWLPDPIYSFLSFTASPLWRRTPEGGGNLYNSSSSFSIPWRSLWDLPKEGRRNYALRQFPVLLQVIRELQSLIVAGTVRLFPLGAGVAFQVRDHARHRTGTRTESTNSAGTSGIPTGGIHNGATPKPDERRRQLRL